MENAIEELVVVEVPVPYKSYQRYNTSIFGIDDVHPHNKPKAILEHLLCRRLFIPHLYSYYPTHGSQGRSCNKLFEEVDASFLPFLKEILEFASYPRNDPVRGL